MTCLWTLTSLGVCVCVCVCVCVSLGPWPLSLDEADAQIAALSRPRTPPRFPPFGRPPPPHGRLSVNEFDGYDGEMLSSGCKGADVILPFHSPPRPLGPPPPHARHRPPSVGPLPPGRPSLHCPKAPQTTACVGLPLQIGIPPGWGAYPVPVPRSPGPHPLGDLRRTCQCLMSRPQAVGDPPHAVGHPTVLQGKCPQETLRVDCPCQSSWTSRPWDLAAPPIQQACTGYLLQGSPEGNTLHMFLLPGSQVGVALSLRPLLSLPPGPEDHHQAATQPLGVSLLCTLAVCVAECLHRSRLSPSSCTCVSYSRQTCTRQPCQSPSRPTASQAAWPSPTDPP